MDNAQKYIGKIITIIKASEKDGNFNMECVYPNKLKIDAKTEEKVKSALLNLGQVYGASHIEHCYYLVDKFYKIENFIKGKNYALYGKKKFYLDKMGLKPNSSVEEIAEKIKNKYWEDFE